MKQMVQLDELIKNKNLGKLILFFIRNPTQEFSYKEIKNKLKLAKATLTKWLKHLVKNKLIELEKIGTTKRYKLKKTNPIVKQLKILDNVTSLSILKELEENFNCDFYLYGSGARGEDIEKSDIDLLIIGKIKKEKIINNINKMEKILNKKIRTQIFSKAEWSRMQKKDPAFYERIEKDKIKLKWT